MTEDTNTNRALEESTDMSSTERGYREYHPDGPRPYGRAEILGRSRGQIPGVTILADAREDAGVKAGDEYRIIGEPGQNQVTFVPLPGEDDNYKVEPLPDEVDLGTQTVQAYKQDSGSLYVHLPEDALDVIGAKIGDYVEFMAATDGVLRLRRW